MQDTPLFQEHEVKDRPNYKQFAVPLSLHMDGTPVTGIGKPNSQSEDIYSWSSLTAIGSTMDILFLFSQFSRISLRNQLWATQWMSFGAKWFGRCGGYGLANGQTKMSMAPDTRRRTTQKRTARDLHRLQVDSLVFFGLTKVILISFQVIGIINSYK